MTVVFYIQNIFDMKSYRPKIHSSYVQHDMDEILTEPDASEYTADADLSLQQDCLEKLRTQRTKIEQLSKLYEANQDKLQKMTQENQKLRQENQRLFDMASYKDKYEQLQREYDRVYEHSKKTQIQVDSIRAQLQAAIHDKSQILIKMKNEIKISKTRYSSEKQQMEETLTDQQNIIMELKQNFVQKEKDYQNQIQQLKTVIANLKSELARNTSLAKEFEYKYQHEIDLKSEENMELNRLLNIAQRQIKKHKQECFNLEQLLEKRDQQHRVQIDKVKQQLSIKVSDLRDKQNNCRDFKSQITKIKNLLSQQQKEKERVLVQNKNFKENYEKKAKCLEQEIYRQKNKYETTIIDFRNSIEELMEVKNRLLIENKKLTQILKKKQEQQRARKQLLRNQCKEIDKLQRIVDKIL